MVRRRRVGIGGVFGVDDAAQVHGGSCTGELNGGEEGRKREEKERKRKEEKDKQEITALNQGKRTPKVTNAGPAGEKQNKRPKEKR